MLCTCAVVSCKSPVLLTSLSPPHSTLFLHTSYVSNGFPLSASESSRIPCAPRPWRHVSALRALAHEIYASLDEHPHGIVGELQGDNWAPARWFFDERRVHRRTDLGGAGKWHQWSSELDEHHSVRLSSSSRMKVLEYNI
jgi:hypothetical protein